MTSNIVSLIRKDFYSLLSEKMLGYMPVVYCLIVSSLFASTASYFSLFIMFVTVTSYIQNVSNLEEKYQTEKAFASLPVRRSEIVFARYSGVMVITCIYIVMAYLTNGVLIFLTKGKTPPIPIGYFASVILIVSLTTSITIPFNFKYGFSKAKTIIIIIYLVLISPLLIESLEIYGGSHSYIETVLAAFKSPFPNSMVTILLFTCISIMLLGVSICLSVATYSKKDL